MDSSGEPDHAPGPIRSLIASLANVLASLIGIVQTRLELFSTELHEEARNAASVLLWAFIAVLAAGMTLFLGALALIFAFWDTHRVLVSLLVTGAFLAIALVAALMVRARLKGRGRPFDATLAELAKDGEQLRARFEQREAR
jgi:uncharacterized membrane protein YqjE